jgi:uncharacterized protein YndB with AHSA1/START domain
MSSRPDTPTPTADREIVVIRTFDAPRELVWRAWTDPTQIVRWWGPTGFTTTSHEMDVRPGGTWRFDMHGPDGRDYPNRIAFIEVQRPERIVYEHRGEADVEPVSFRSTVSFEQQGDKTRLTLRMVFPTTEERDRVNREYGADEGAIQTIGRLAEHLASATGTRPDALTFAMTSSRNVILTRTFDAPRRVVFEALSKPEHVRRWWGPRSPSLVVCEMDFRPGGTWRFVLRDPDGTDHAFTGVYKEIVAPERFVQTFVYDVDGIRDHPATETFTLEERNSRTILRNVVLHQSQEARDGHFHSGMESGASERMDRLDELVGTMAASSISGARQ